MDEINIVKEEKQNNNSNPIPPTNHYPKNNDIVFLPSRFNEEAPTKFKLLLFLFGFLGLQAVALVVSLVLYLAIQDELLVTALSNFLAYLLTFIGVIIIFNTYSGGKYFKIILSGFKKKNTYIWAALMLGLALLIETIISLINMGILSAVNNSGSTTSINEQSITEIFQSSYAILMILPVVIFAPIIEEITYRLGLVDLIGKKNRLRGLIISSIIFGFLHFNGLLILLEMAGYPVLIEIGFLEADVTLEALAYDFLVEVLNLPIYVLMGACLGLSYIITGDITTSILAHAVNNLLSTIISLVSGTALGYMIPEFVVKFANLSLNPYMNSIFSFIAK